MKYVVFEDIYQHTMADTYPSEWPSLLVHTGLPTMILPTLKPFSTYGLIFYPDNGGSRFI